MISDVFGRFSTGLKMLLILSAALLPLGLIAIFASVEFARNNRLMREADIRLVATTGEQRLTGTISAIGNSVRNGLVGNAPPTPPVCRERLDAILSIRHLPIALGIFDRRGRRICATNNLSRLIAVAPAPGIGLEARLSAKANMMRFSLGNLPGGAILVGEVPRTTLTQLTVTPRGDNDYDDYGVRLREGDVVINLTAPMPMQAIKPLGKTIAVSIPALNGQLSLEYRSPLTPIRAIEALMILLPIMMWLAAALIGWLVMERLVLAPLGLLQRAIATYRPEQGAGLQLPALTTPSHEIRDLAEAFAAATEMIAANRADLEAGLARQTKLTREVHHRVKNNLQVVSSLINLHSRSATSPEAATAYASIRRRVDALAVVHRNHFAELEENRGVDLRPLIGELAANFGAVGGPDSARMTITVDLIPAFVSQDVAVPVAFLVTELAELAMNCDPTGKVAIRLEQTEKPDRALLTLSAPALVRERCRTHPSAERASKVMEGLARQLRAPLTHDEGSGRYAIEIKIVSPDEKAPIV